MLFLVRRAGCADGWSNRLLAASIVKGDFGESLIPLVKIKQLRLGVDSLTRVKPGRNEGGRKRGELASSRWDGLRADRPLWGTTGVRAKSSIHSKRGERLTAFAAREESLGEVFYRLAAGDCRSC
jgi:hypothetical protein